MPDTAANPDGTGASVLQDDVSADGPASAGHGPGAGGTGVRVDALAGPDQPADAAGPAGGDQMPPSLAADGADEACLPGDRPASGLTPTHDALGPDDGADGAVDPAQVADASGPGGDPDAVPAAAPLRGLPIWNLHPLNVRLGLTGILSDVRAAAREAVALAASHVEVPDFDLIVRGQPGAGIAEWGLGGCAPVPGVIEITIDPPRYGHARFVRTLIHELHHLIRWDGPGYGHSLGEALVSEGLAGHFVLQVLGGPPDPWDATAPSSSALRQAMNDWSRRDHDHAAWFFGKAGMRRWSGYGLGHRLVAGHLARHPGATAASLATVPADRFREDMRRLAQAEERAVAPDGTGAAPAKA